MWSVEPGEDVHSESQHAGSSRLDGARPGVCSPSIPTNVSNSSISPGQGNVLERDLNIARALRQPLVDRKRGVDGS
jgi:hypothetical protein